VWTDESDLGDLGCAWCAVPLDPPGEVDAVTFLKADLTAWAFVGFIMVSAAQR